MSTYDKDRAFEDTMTCGLRAGDMVEIMFKGGTPSKGCIVSIYKIAGANVWVNDIDGKPVPAHFSERSSLKLVSRARGLMATPVKPPAPEKKLKDKTFGEAGVLPSDMPGINEMLKKGFKEVFGQSMPAPAKRTLPSSKALFITASEKYMGIGYNDTIGGS